jgi:predicted N-acyltransferase
MPVETCSAHWLAHPEFATAIGQFLEREDRGIRGYLDDLDERRPYK